MQARHRTQVSIIGGGMVGISFALALAQQTRNQNVCIQLIESFPLGTSAAEPVYNPSFDARSTALSWGSARILEDIGVWAQLSRHAAPIHNIHVSQAGRWGANRISRTDADVDALGYVVENQWIGASLSAALHTTAGIEVIAPAKVRQLQPDDSSWRMELEQQGAAVNLDSDLVILADGGRSGLRDQLGIGTRQTDYGQHAVICNLRFERAHEQRAYERFTPDGPLAMLPLPDHRVSLVWCLPPEQAERLEAAPETEFMAALQHAFGHRMGRIQRIGERARYPLQLEVADAPGRPGLLLLGNAAHTLHPIAGQGFNLSIRDLQVLAARLGAAAGGGIASLRPALQQYIDERKADQERTLGMTHGLNLLFSNLLPGLPALRSAGMVATEILPGLRDTITRQALGVWS